MLLVQCIRSHSKTLLLAKHKTFFSYETQICIEFRQVLVLNNNTNLVLLMLNTHIYLLSIHMLLKICLDCVVIWRNYFF